MQNIMTKTTETAAGETVENQQPAATETPQSAEVLQHPEIFEAHGLEWYRHDGSDQCPCDPELKIQVLFRNWKASIAKNTQAGWRWSWNGFLGDVIAWRPADAPAKLPRPGPTYDSVHAMMVGEGVSQPVQDMVKGLETQDDVQALKDRIAELEAQLEAKLEDIVKAADQIDHWKKLARRESDGRINAEEKLNSASTPTLRPIAEMPDAVPEGCVRVYGNKEHTQHGMKFWGFHQVSQQDIDTHFLDIRLSAPPDPDEELRREFEAWWSAQPERAGKHKSECYEAYKAGRAKEGAR